MCSCSPAMLDNGTWQVSHDCIQIDLCLQILLFPSTLLPFPPSRWFVISKYKTSLQECSPALIPTIRPHPLALSPSSFSLSFTLSDSLFRGNLVYDPIIFARLPFLSSRHPTSPCFPFLHHIALSIKPSLSLSSSPVHP